MPEKAFSIEVNGQRVPLDPDGILNLLYEDEGAEKLIAAIAHELSPIAESLPGHK
jgi:hypothetical protein